MARVATVATELEERARARWTDANHCVQLVDRRRTAALERAGRLSAEELPVALRSHLTTSGARHLVALADERATLTMEAEARRAELEVAATKVRSLERLIDRLDRADELQRRRRAEAELRDLMAIRAARSESRRTS